MFQNMMNNDPRPSYVHQTNIMGTPPAGSEGTADLPPSTYTPPATCTAGAPCTQGDGTLYQVLDPLLYEYKQYFNSSAPIQQLTEQAIANLLAEQSAWAANTEVSGYIQGNQVTVTNSGTGATEIPLTGTTSVGSSYGGTTSGWTSAPAGTSTYTAQSTWPVDSVTASLSPSSIEANGSSTSTATATVSSQGNPVAGDPVSFSSSDAGEKIGAVTASNGTYTATITSSKTAGTATITATDPAVQPDASAQATLTQTAPPAPPPTVTTTTSPVTTTTSPGTKPTSPGQPTRPSNKTLPTISGSWVVGHTLSASKGTWSGTAPISYAYQWQRCKQRCANIAGANRSSYKLGAADTGAKLQVVVTATNRKGAVKATSRQVGPVLTAGQVKARLISALLPRGSGARIGALLSLGGYRFSFSSPGSAHLAISWDLPAKGKRVVVVATMSASLQGTSNLKIALTAKGKQALKSAKHLTLTTQGTLSLTGGSPITASRSFTVTR
jgi:Invasin, domain 3